LGRLAEGGRLGDRSRCEQEEELKMAESNRSMTTVVTPTKSVGISIILTVLFGPLGMFYTTILGGVIMTIMTLVAFVVTLGFGAILTWPICVIWGAIAAKSYNKGLLSGATHA
jgi:hypothetical protein